MIKREQAVQEIKGWIVDEAAAHGLKAIKRTPTAPPNVFPAVFIHEGDDVIVKPSRQKWHGYPAERAVELIIEMWTLEDTDIKALFGQIRNLLFAGKLSNSCGMKELRAYGPFNGGVQGAVCMQIVLALSYTDSGPAAI